MKRMKQVLYCEECHFNYPIGAAAKPKCPDCSKRMTVVNCADEAKLIAFVEELKNKRGTD